MVYYIQFSTVVIIRVIVLIYKKSAFTVGKKSVSSCYAGYQLCDKPITHDNTITEMDSDCGDELKSVIHFSKKRHGYLLLLGPHASTRLPCHLLVASCILYYFQFLPVSVCSFVCQHDNTFPHLTPPLTVGSWQKYALYCVPF